MVVDEADHVETIGHDLGLGEVLADQGAVGARQIHADDAYAVLSRQFRQVGFQSGLTASQHDIEDLMGAQVAEGGGISILPGKEMLIDAENAWAGGAAALGDLASEVVLEPAFHRSAADGFPPA